MSVKQTFIGKYLFLKKTTKSSAAATIPVKVRHFNRLKVYTAAASVGLIVLLFVMNSLSKKAEAQASEHAKLIAQINKLHKQLGQETIALDSATTQQQTSDQKAMSYIGSIEEKLTRINTYLSKRGLHGFSFKHIKKPASKTDQKLTSEVIYSSYDNYLNRLVDNVANMPMGYPRISAFTSFFGARSNPFDFGLSEFHPGIDFRGKTGDPVKCTASGIVEFAGPAGGYGNCIRIKHTASLETVYGHLSHIGVHPGQKVSVGDVIGKVGSTGRSTGSHLHYEVRRNGKAVNPAQYLTLN